jgi:hypothetical protein
MSLTQRSTAVALDMTEQPVPVCSFQRRDATGKITTVKSFNRVLENEKLWIYIASFGLTYEDIIAVSPESKTNTSHLYKKFYTKWYYHFKNNKKFTAKKPIPLPRLSQLTVKPTNLTRFPVAKPRPARTLKQTECDCCGADCPEYFSCSSLGTGKYCDWCIDIYGTTAERCEFWSLSPRDLPPN